MVAWGQHAHGQAEKGVVVSLAPIAATHPFADGSDDIQAAQGSAQLSVLFQQEVDRYNQMQQMDAQAVSSSHAQPPSRGWSLRRLGVRL